MPSQKTAQSRVVVACHIYRRIYCRGASKSGIADPLGGPHFDTLPCPAVLNQSSGCRSSVPGECPNFSARHSPQKNLPFNNPPAAFTRPQAVHVPLAGLAGEASRSASLGVSPRFLQRWTRLRAASARRPNPRNLASTFCHCFLGATLEETANQASSDHSRKCNRLTHRRTVIWETPMWWAAASMEEGNRSCFRIGRRQPLALATWPRMAFET